MTSVAEDAYQLAVLSVYISLPDTPQRVSSYDKAVARSLLQQGVPLEVVEAGLLLGSLRRRIRPPGAMPLGRIRSLAYFSGVIGELPQHLPAGYLDYLRHKARQIFPSAAVSQDRSPR